MHGVLRKSTVCLFKVSSLYSNCHRQKDMYYKINPFFWQWNRIIKIKKKTFYWKINTLFTLLRTRNLKPSSCDKFAQIKVFYYILASVFSWRVVIIIIYLYCVSLFFITWGWVLCSLSSIEFDLLNPLLNLHFFHIISVKLNKIDFVRKKIIL